MNPRFFTLLLIILFLAVVLGANSEHPEVLDYADIEPEARCSDRQFDQNDWCKTGRPYAYALYRKIVHGGTNWWGIPVCNPHPNISKKSQEYPRFVQSCCVNACAIEVGLRQYTIGYFVSGTRKIKGGETSDFEDEDIVEDDQCQDCWGSFTLRRKDFSITSGPLCKRGESWAVGFSFSYEIPIDKIQNETQNLLAAANLPPCEIAEFRSVSTGDLVPPPAKIEKLILEGTASGVSCSESTHNATKPDATNPTNIDEPESEPLPSPTSDRSSDSSDDEKGECEDTPIHTWLVPALLGLVGTISLGVFSLYQRHAIVNIRGQLHAIDPEFENVEERP